jgi:hypothetical protein
VRTFNRTYLACISLDLVSWPIMIANLKYGSFDIFICGDDADIADQP